MKGNKVPHNVLGSNERKLPCGEIRDKMNWNGIKGISLNIVQ